MRHQRHEQIVHQRNPQQRRHRNRQVKLPRIQRLARSQKTDIMLPPLPRTVRHNRTDNATNECRQKQSRNERRRNRQRRINHQVVHNTDKQQKQPRRRVNIKTDTFKHVANRPKEHRRHKRQNNRKRQQQRRKNPPIPPPMITPMNPPMILNIRHRKRPHATQLTQHNHHLRNRILPRHRHLQNLKINKVSQKKQPRQNRWNQEKPQRNRLRPRIRPLRPNHCFFILQCHLNLLAIFNIKIFHNGIRNDDLMCFFSQFLLHAPTCLMCFVQKLTVAHFGVGCDGG